MSLIDAEDVSVEFSDFELEGVDLELKRGEILGILGPNGAGKSTLMKTLTGQIKRRNGDISVLGIDPSRRPVELREEIGILPEREDPPSFLTGDEYIDFVSDIRGDNFDEQLAERLGLNEDLRGQQTRNLSKGERQKFMIVQAFLHNPELVFIDEPLINLDPLTQEEVKKIFREHRSQDGSMVLSTHLVSLAEELCDKVLFLKDGEVIDLVENPDEGLKDRFIEAEG